jgi:hypothetical protein
VAGFALAQDRPLSPDEVWARADANKDGKVDKAELLATLNSDAKPFIEAVWEARDTNRDGSISREELLYNGPAGGRAAPLQRPGATAPAPKQ